MEERSARGTGRAGKNFEFVLYPLGGGKPLLEASTYQSALTNDREFHKNKEVKRISEESSVLHGRVASLRSGLAHISRIH